MSSVNPNRTSVTRSLLLALMAVLTGCLDDGDGSSDNEASVGRLNYNGISGLGYQTSSQSGTTNAQGEFRFYPGETLTLLVGNLALVEDVPAQAYVTPLEFFDNTRSALMTPAPGELGLSTHTVTEQQLLNNSTLINLTRFLMALNWTTNVREGEAIQIRDRVISQLNAELPNLSAAIDFTVNEAEFALEEEAVLSPANQLLKGICFYPEGDDLCKAPPTLADIEQATPRPTNPADQVAGTLYREDLEAKRARVLDAVRSLKDIEREEVELYLTRELNAISTAFGNRYYLDDDVAAYPSSDSTLKTVGIRRIAGDIALMDLEATSTRPTDVHVHATNWQAAEVDYFVVGESDGEAEVILSFRPEGTYRWINKQLRVLIR